jgi:glutamyl-tRNA synthetase
MRASRASSKGVFGERDLGLPADADDRLARAIPLVKERARTIPELADLCIFALWRGLLTDKDRALLTDEVKDRLQRLSADLDQASDWTAAAMRARLKAFAGAEAGFGGFGPARRAILAAAAVAPALASALAALGKEASLARIAAAL